MMLDAGGGKEIRNVRGGQRDGGNCGGSGLRGVGKGLEGGDGFPGEIDEVRSLDGEEEADMGGVNGLVADAVVGEAVA